MALETAMSGRRWRRRSLAFLVLACCAFGGLLTTPAPADVIGCHAVGSGPGHVMHMLVDLDCTGDTSGVFAAIVVPNGFTLYMDGHSIRGADFGIDCRGNCVIFGPGDISDTDIGVSIEKQTTIRNVNIHDNNEGIYAVEDYENHLARLKLRDVHVDHNAEIGIGAETMSGTNVTANGNGGSGLYGDMGISVVTVTGTNLQASNNVGSGFRVDKLSVTGLVATGNGGPGADIWRKANLRSSTLTGNNGLGAGVDVVMHSGDPSLHATTCGRSARPDGTSMHICANDP